ncbi:MAG: hypothetical protein WC455_15630 [Dehalococcoidia bacterium]|jgi:archaellum component FlaG (FlaF/FlaG flagellin family)
MKKLLTISLITFLMVTLLGGAVFAASYYFRTLDVSLTVAEGVKELSFYDSANSVEIRDSIQVASVQRGGSISYTFTLKNTGVEPLRLSFKTDPEILPWGSVTTAAIPYELASGESSNITVTFAVSANATIGQQEPFELVFYE